MPHSRPHSQRTVPNALKNTAEKGRKQPDFGEIMSITFEFQSQPLDMHFDVKQRLDELHILHDEWQQADRSLERVMDFMKESGARKRLGRTLRSFRN
jgi:hypothetical protein